MVAEEEDKKGKRSRRAEHNPSITETRYAAIRIDKEAFNP